MHTRSRGRPAARPRVSSPLGSPGAGLQPCPRQPPGGSKSPALRQRCPPLPPSPCTENLVNLWGSAAKRLPCLCLCAGGQQRALAPCRAFRTPPFPRPCGDFARLTNAPETLMEKQGHQRVSSTMLINFFPCKNKLGPCCGEGGAWRGFTRPGHGRKIKKEKKKKVA